MKNFLYQGLADPLASWLLVPKLPRKRPVLYWMNFTRIAYREAADGGFTVPGICRLDVVLRKPRRMKNPQIRETILIGEHRTLRARIVPPGEGGHPAARKTWSPCFRMRDPRKRSEDFSNAISFCCKKCGQEIEAPRAAIGIEAHCPLAARPSSFRRNQRRALCTGQPRPRRPYRLRPRRRRLRKLRPRLRMRRPHPRSHPPPPQNRPPPPRNRLLRPRSPNRRHAAARRYGSTWRHWDSRRKSMPSPRTLSAKRMLSFFCKNCRQEIEAPADMAGTSSECPACGVSFEVPFFSDPGTLHGSDLDDREPGDPEVRDARARTIRIEVPDDF